jgi:hypothetical protein
VSPNPAAPAADFSSLLPLLGLLFGSAVASGLRLYATVAVLGFLGRAGIVALPSGWKALENPWVIGIAAALYLVEFLADKVPIVDSVWDAVHTLVRAPAAALLAFAATAGVPEVWRIAAALLCGGVAFSAHGLKASTRAAINTSPEPVTNWAASFAEEGLVAVVLWAAVAHPLAALAAAVVVAVSGMLLAVWIARMLKRLFGVRPAAADAR